MCPADKVHYVNGPGEVLHAFDAEAGEELSVYAGEEVMLTRLHTGDLEPSPIYLCKQGHSHTYSAD